MEQSPTLWVIVSRFMDWGSKEPGRFTAVHVYVRFFLTMLAMHV